MNALFVFDRVRDGSVIGENRKSFGLLAPNMQIESND